MDPHGTPVGTFASLGISPRILSILDALKYTIPTPIQARAIAPGLAGTDVVGIAQTGTGKTLAFGIPIIQHIIESDGRALVLVPTRELALQAEETFLKVGRPLGVRTAVLIGGAAMRPQIEAIRRGPDVVIATPGRLIDHLEQGILGLSTVSILVLDEADRMLDMGFLPQIKRILSAVPTERQTMLFSATLSREIFTIAQKTMKTPVQIEVAPQGTTSENVTQELFLVRGDEKLRLLEKILSETEGPTLVFCRTKHGARKIAARLTAIGHKAADIQGNRSLAQRKQALAGFKSGQHRVLVATDIVARGIDVQGVAFVINYDLPGAAADYVHRIGRTGRAGAQGHAISFVLPQEKRDIRDIEHLIRKAIDFTPLPILPAATPGSSLSHYDEEDAPRGGSRGRGSSGGGGRGGRPSGASHRRGPSFHSTGRHRR